jgi:hypothetical protein
MEKFSTGLRNMIGGINTNLVSNGAGVTGDDSHWSGTGATPSIANGGLTITDTGSGNGYATKTITTVVGKMYKVTAQVEVISSATGNIFVGEVSAPTATLAAAFTDAAFATKKLAFVATSTATTIGLKAVAASGAVVFKNITCSLVTNGIQDALEGCVKTLFAGAMPTSADADLSRFTKIGTYYSDGSSAGLSFDDCAAGVLSKASAQTWSGTTVADGTVAFMAMYLPTDDLSATTTLPRIMGSVATSGSDEAISPVATLVSGIPIIATQYDLKMPGA